MKIKNIKNEIIKNNNDNNVMAMLYCYYESNFYNFSKLVKKIKNEAKELKIKKFDVINFINYLIELNKEQNLNKLNCSMYFDNLIINGDWQDAIKDYLEIQE